MKAGDLRNKTSTPVRGSQRGRTNDKVEEAKQTATLFFKYKYGAEMEVKNGTWLGEIYSILYLVFRSSKNDWPAGAPDKDVSWGEHNLPIKWCD